MTLAGKTVVVTGAGQGIGEGIALEFATKEARVIVVDSNETGVSNTVKKIQSMTGECIGIKADVSVSTEVQYMINQTVEQYGTVDILVNNAGIMRPGAIQHLAEEDWEKVISVNLKGTFLCSKHAAKVMIPRRKGAIINVASISGHDPLPGAGAYSSSKAAIILLTKQCAVEWGKFNIRVNAISPGLIATPLSAKAYEDENITRGRQKMVSLGRIGTPQDVASVAVSLASDEFSYVTGCDIPVDGGFLVNMQKLLVNLGFRPKSSQ